MVVEIEVSARMFKKVIFSEQSFRAEGARKAGHPRRKVLCLYGRGSRARRVQSVGGQNWCVTVRVSMKCRSVSAYLIV